jgi:hypothetical protein
MTTVADAGILAGCCGVLWLLLALMLRRAGWFGRAVAFTVAAAATTGAAVALGTWREHRRTTVTSAAATFGGMCVFWLLAALQTRRAAVLTLDDPPVELPSEQVPAGPVPASESGEDALSRRERRLAHRRWHRRGSVHV